MNWNRPRFKMGLICASMIAALLITALFPENWVLLFIPSKKLYPAAHFTAYFCFTLAMTLGLRFCRFPHRFILPITLISSTLVGVVTEAIQVYTPDRIPSLEDFYCDMAGIILGLVIFYGILLGKRIVHRQQPSPQPSLIRHS